MIYHTLVPHMRTVDMNTPRDLQRTRFNTCKNSSAKAKSSDRRKRSYYLQVAAKTFIINVCQQIYTRTPFCQPFHFNCNTKHFSKKTKTPQMKFELSLWHAAISLSEIWNFGTPKGTVWTQTQWQKIDQCQSFQKKNFITFVSHNEKLGGRASAINLAQACRTVLKGNGMTYNGGCVFESCVYEVYGCAWLPSG